MAIALGQNPLADLVGANIAVPLVQGGQARYVNLDYAASTPSLVQVAARVAEVLPWYASVHRGPGYLSLVSTSLYESAGATLQRFVGARRDDVVIFTRNIPCWPGSTTAAAPCAPVLVSAPRPTTSTGWCKPSRATCTMGPVTPIRAATGGPLLRATAAPALSPRWTWPTPASPPRPHCPGNHSGSGQVGEVPLVCPGAGRRLRPLTSVLRTATSATSPITTISREGAMNTTGPATA